MFNIIIGREPLFPLSMIGWGSGGCRLWERSWKESDRERKDFIP